MAPAEVPDTVSFFYIKGTQFRVVHSDGVIGGITPRGFIHCAFYNERAAIPQVQTHNVSPEGQLSPPVSTDGKVGIVREIDFDVIMTKQAAVDLRDWLTQQIKELDQYAQAKGTQP
ncbi:hypothetical protein [Bradyrhizobium sp. SZCCHNR1051]|uniref:hypothetical protein n=1 Tax=Bradyrhizobium sp. SZCCHNR1051 TaxID=3057355 RepID=UPI0029169D41|nr:hypothetical protein [Bradyrhizobium sp. SZCCHNR1051]